MKHKLEECAHLIPTAIAIEAAEGSAQRKCSFAVFCCGSRSCVDNQFSQ